MHVMIDLETLGNGPDAVIAQVAAVAFELKSGGKVYDTKAFNRYVHPDSCAAVGMAYDASTIEWWLKQDGRARLKLFGSEDNPAAGIKLVLLDLVAWPGTALDTNWQSIEGVWANGAAFDAPILETAYRRTGLGGCPWPFRRMYDQRTAYLLLGGKPNVPNVGTGHDAVDDCIYQICGLQAALAQAGG